MRYVSSRRWQVYYFDFSSGFDFENMTCQVVELGNTPLVYVLWGQPVVELGNTPLVHVLWGQPIKLIQVVFTSEFHEY